MSKASKIINIFIFVFAIVVVVFGVLLFQKREQITQARSDIAATVEKVSRLIDPSAVIPADDLKISKTPAEVKEAMVKLESAAEAANEAGDGFLPETATMAEIYAGQGHYEQAIKIYRDKLERDPSDEHASRRIAELEALLNRNNPQE